MLNTDILYNLCQTAAAWMKRGLKMHERKSLHSALEESLYVCCPWPLKKIVRSWCPKKIFGRTHKNKMYSKSETEYIPFIG